MQTRTENKPMWWSLIVAGSLASALAAGCAQEQEPSQTVKPSVTPAAPDQEQTQAKETSPTETAEAAAVGHLSGVITYEGPQPELPLLVRQGTQIKDAEVCAAHDVPDESLVVDGTTKGLANVFVYISRAPKGAQYPPVPHEPITFEQKGCRFIPHALVVRVGQPVLVKSDDPITHNVHTLPVRNATLNTASPPNDQTGIELIYRQSEPAPVHVKCDIHSWMSALQLPLDHPFMAVTDAQGRFEIRNLPAGKHEFRIWHERAEFLERKYEVEIKAGETREVSLSYPANMFTGGRSGPK